MCGSHNSPPPPPTAEETELRQLQIDALKQQTQQQKIFGPLQAEQFGYEQYTRKVKDINEAASLFPELEAERQQMLAFARGDKELGKTKDLAAREKNIAALEARMLEKSVTDYKKTEGRIAQEAQLAELQGLQLETAKKSNKAISDYIDSLSTPEAKAAQAKQATIDAQQQDIALQQGERQKLALEGKLPVSQGTIDRKAQEFATLKETLARSGNNIIGDDASTAYALSSPGAQALDLFNRRYGAIESQERQGTLDSSAQTYLQSVGLAGDIGNQAYGRATGSSNIGGFAGTSPALRGGSPVTNNMNLIQGYSAAMQPYMQDRSLAYQGSLANSQIAAQDRAGWLNLAGTFGGAAAGAYMYSNSR